MKRLSLSSIIMIILPFLMILLVWNCSEGDSTLDGDTDSVVDGDEESALDGDDDVDQGIADGDLDAEEDIAAGPAVFAVLSDTHIYMTDEPNNLILKEAGAIFNASDPPVEFVVLTGDIIHDLFCVEGVNCQEMTIIKVYRSIIEEHFDMPVYSVLGNHDNRFFDTFGSNDLPLQLWLDAFEGSDSFPAPYYVVEHKGMNFVMMFCSDMAYDHDSNDKCNFGEEQLDWLKGLLQTGKPAVLFWHQHLFPNKESDINNPIFPIVQQYKDVIKGVFMGHGHIFKKVVWEGVPFMETGACSGKDEPIYHMVQMNPADGSFEILNKDDIQYRD